MCGIAGLIQLDKSFFFENKNIFKLMNNRGPDDKGFYENKNLTYKIQLFHSRLRIIDDNTRSNQPHKFKNYVMIYNGNKWMLNDRDDSIQNLIDDKESIIEQKLEEWIENGNKYPDIMKKFNKYLEKKENDKIINKVKSEIKLMLFNNRDIM